MQKLTIKEVVFVSEGRQLRELILKTYSFKEFAYMTNHTEKTLNRYLGKKIKINKFKKDLKRIFKKEVSSLIDTLEQQFEDYFIEILNNIDQYNEDNDIHIFYKLIEQSPSKYHELLAEILIAHYRYNIKLRKEACYKLEKIIKKAKKNQYHGIVILAVSELGFMYLSNINKSIEIFNKHYYIIQNKPVKVNRITKVALYKYHYKYGVALNRGKRYDDAMIQFKNTVAYAENKQLNQIYSSFANSFACQGKYEEAEKQLHKALACELSLNDMLIIYNNLAYLYSCRGKIEESKKYINMVISNMDDSIPVDKRMNYIHTLLTIYDYEKDCFNFNVALELIREIKHICNNVHIIKQFIKGLLTYCEENKDMVKSNRILYVFKQVIKKLPNNDFTVQLKGIYFDIYFGEGDE